MRQVCHTGSDYPNLDLIERDLWYVTEIIYFPSLHSEGYIIRFGPFKERKHHFLLAQTILYILKIKQCSSKFRVKFRHLLSNTMVDLENGVAYEKNAYYMVSL